MYDLFPEISKKNVLKKVITFQSNLLQKLVFKKIYINYWTFINVFTVKICLKIRFNDRLF